MNRKLVLVFLTALLLRLVLSPLFWHPDVTNHLDWGIRFFEYGIDKIYAPESNVWSFTWPNQPPGTMLIFAFIRKFYELVFGFLWNINVSIPSFPSVIITLAQSYLYQVFVKLPAILSDLGIAYLIYLFVEKFNKKSAIWAAAAFLFNPVIWYNSSVWGQTDAVVNFLFLLGFWLLLKKRLFYSMIFVCLCLFVKISLAIFLPIFIIFLIRQKFSWSKILFSGLLSFVIIMLITLPFSGGNNPTPWLYEIYKTKVMTNQLQVITANAFNIWISLTGIAEKPHTLFLGPLTYQSWGVLLFGASIIPVFVMLWKKPTELAAIWGFFIIAFSSWLLLTNMHERYLYPAFPFLTILAFKYKKMLPVLFGLSALNLLNLYNLWWTPLIPFVKNIMSYSDFLLARVFGIVNTVFYMISYKQYLIDSRDIIKK